MTSRAAPVLVLACAAQFMVVLDVSVVNVALPAIRDALGFATADGLSWVATGYALAFAGLLLPGGRLADLLGHRRVFVAGLALFTVASLAGGLATGPGVLVAARAAQGLGAAVLAPATLTVLTTTFPEGPRRSRALAVWTAVSSVGGAAGNLLGGVLTDALSWRAVLLVNVPVGCAVLLSALRFLPDGDLDGDTDSTLDGEGHRTGGQRKRRRPDLPGALAATVGMAALTFGVSRTQHASWGDPATVWALVGGAAALVVFLAVERWWASEPLIPPRLLRQRTVAVGNTIVLLAGACLQIPVWYFLTFYMQDVLGYSALRTGLGFLPHTLIGAAVAVWCTPRLMRRFAHRTLILSGAVVCGGGFLWQSTVTADSGYVAGVLGPAVVFSLGSAVFVTPTTAVVTAGVPAGEAGAASGLLNTSKQFGGALGLAALSAVAGPDGTGHERVFVTMAGVLAVIALLALALPRARHAPGPDGYSGAGRSTSPSRRSPSRIS
ncbi:MFS transporter [Streptomyces oryzae]|uniref:MFS transporter n=1 Tax=Streptomyces oryzae TaxID=1434886 RepID=A0ABS3X521_9ACTN|nr:MFS transporter [Streptomyces oryzae]MBO8190474.1 MFS transporter [Streptomyces oryzae]